MISLKEVIEKLKVEPLTSHQSLDRQVASGYASDLLSCVIKGAKKDSIWVTLQSHLNVVAVASLLGLVGCHHHRGKSTGSGNPCQGRK